MTLLEVPLDALAALVDAACQYMLAIVTDSFVICFLLIPLLPFHPRLFYQLHFVCHNPQECLFVLMLAAWPLGCCALR